MSLHRYEVSYFDPDTNHRKALGGAATPEDAQKMAATIEAHSTWQFPQILDRWAEQESNRAATEADGDEECEAGALHWERPRLSVS